MQELETLQTKINLLLKKHQELKKENARLKKMLSSQKEDLNALNRQFDHIEQNIALERIGTTVLSETEKKTVKKQITHVIKEIDKLLLSLND